ncbi:MAG: hypothetical protein ABIM74_00165 [candidate division WOR-3 bacterium]
MDTADRIKEGIKKLKMGRLSEVARYIETLKAQDPLAAGILEVSVAFYRAKSAEVVRKGKRLLAKVSDKPEIALYLFDNMGMAYRMLGEMDRAESFFIKFLEAAELLGHRKAATSAKMSLLSIRLFKAEYETLYCDIKKFLKEEERPDALYMFAVLHIIRGMPEQANKILESLLRLRRRPLFLAGVLEMKGLALRLMGRCDESMESYLGSIQAFLDLGSAYSAFPCAKAMNLSRLSGFDAPPQDTVKKCLSLARSGSWGEQAAAQEIKALLLQEEDETACMLFEAAQNYYRAYQPLEAFLAGLTSAFLAWRSNGPTLPQALKFLNPLASLHPGLKHDPFLRDFLIQIEPLVNQRETEPKSGIKAYLIGETKITVDNKDIRLKAWRNNKAILGLIYLLLSPKHRIPYDHLFYLLWPRRKYTQKSRCLLYTAINTIRTHLIRRELLVKHRDFYQLEDVWTDLGELENLLRLADATRDPTEKEEYLARARELANGDLLPEFPYDRYIDEYRQYYERLKKKIYGKE